MRGGPWKLDEDLRKRAPKRSEGRSISREEWVDFALEVIAKEGFSALLGGRLARYMDLPKSSYYHRFKGGQKELDSAVLERFLETRLDVLRKARAGNGSPAETLLQLMTALVVRDPVEHTMRAWALHAIQVAAYLETLDESRLAVVRGILLSAGVSKDEADFRARQVIYATIAEQVVFPAQKRPEIEARLKEICRRFCEP